MILKIDPKIILGFLSAIIVFMYAIDSFSKEIIRLSTKKIHSTVSQLTQNRIYATTIGAISTALVHSSSAITTITVLLVSMGHISFQNSLGIIFGANIGTTVTAQLALLDSSIIASILIIIGFILNFLGKNFRILSKSIFFLGFILFSLNLLSISVAPMKDSPEIITLFSHLDSAIIGFLLSALFTTFVQSSSITTGILIVLASAGLLKTNVAIAMIFGANIGSSTTALLASLKLDIFAKKAAVANLLFNLSGSLLFLIFLSPFVTLISYLSKDIATQTATAHLLFNLINTAIFLVFLTPYSNLINKIIKSDEHEILFQTRYLQPINKQKTNKVLANVKKELSYTIKVTIKIFETGISLNKRFEQKKQLKIEKLENLNDFLDENISNILIHLSDRKLPQNSAEQIIK